ncbi:MAG TPA: L,D-transpeptidase [Gemmatimonadales bacterium]|nr:L,D-transpeptidase [Gemmatimonadales bacterium]
MDIHRGAPEWAARHGWSQAQTFRRVAAAAWGRMAALDSAERLTVLKINRVDLRHARRRDLVVPDSIAPELDYSPFPASIPDLAGVPKFILVSRRVQAFGAYVHGTLVRWGPTSTGKPATPTESGLFFANWKSRKEVSTDDPSWILDWYVNFVADRGVAFHEYALPGRPASHGCVRLLEEDAHWLYHWADPWLPGRGPEVKRYGTPILVTGDYDYAAPAPWLALAESPVAGRVSIEDIEAALEPHLDQLRARIEHGAPAAL